MPMTRKPDAKQRTLRAGEVLAIHLSRRKDGAAILRCDRPDGTSTWKKSEGRLATFFALHDLMHFAVETRLAIRRGFYGLVAEGWDIADFATPWPRGPLPADAELAEVVVGFLAADMASGARGTSAELRARVAQHFAGREPGRAPRQLPDFEERSYGLLGDHIEELRQRWLTLPPDGALELSFPLLPPDDGGG
jgi:hypothetical protein